MEFRGRSGDGKRSVGKSLPRGVKSRPKVEGFEVEAFGAEEVG